MLTKEEVAGITTIDGAKAFIAEQRETCEWAGFERPAAFGFGLAHISKHGDLLEALFPVVNFGPDHPGLEVLTWTVASGFKGNQAKNVDPEQLKLALKVLAPWEGDGNPHVNITAIKKILAAMDGPGPDGDRSYQPVAVWIGDLGKPVSGVAEAYFRTELVLQGVLSPWETVCDDPSPFMHFPNTKGLWRALNIGD